MTACLFKHIERTFEFVVLDKIFKLPQPVRDCFFIAFPPDHHLSFAQPFTRIAPTKFEFDASYHGCRVLLNLHRLQQLRDDLLHRHAFGFGFVVHEDAVAEDG